MQTNKTIMSQHVEMAMDLSYCANSEEVENILFNHWDLVNLDLVLEIGVLSADLKHFDQTYRSKILSMLEEWLKNYLEKENIPSQDNIWQFLINLLKIASADSDTQDIIHAEMENNIDLIDWPLGAAMRRYVQLFLLQKPHGIEIVPDEQAIAIISNLLGNVCRSIHIFSCENQQRVESIALTGYDIVLKTTQNYPELYAQALRNMGGTFLSVAESGIDSENNFQKALAIFNEAAEIYKSLNLVEDLFYVIYHKGVIFLFLGELDVDPVANLKQAVTTFDEAIVMCRTTDNLTHKIPNTLYATGSTCHNLAKLEIDTEANFKQALALFQEAAIDCRVNGLFPRLLDITMKSGDIYRSLSTLGITPETNLKKALISFDEAAIICQDKGICQIDGVKKNLPVVLDRKGNIYKELANLGIDPESNLLQSALSFNEASMLYKTLGLIENLFHVTYQKGVVFTSIAKLNINRENNLQQAAKTFDEASVICRDNSLTQKLPSMLFMIGDAYQNLSELDINTGGNLKKALIAFEEATIICETNSWNEKKIHALTKSSNICILLARLGIDAPSNIQQALVALNEVAKVLREDISTQALMPVLNLLGDTYLFLAGLHVDPSLNLQKALTVFDEVVLIYRLVRLTQEVANILAKSGVIYNSLAELGVEPLSNLQKSLAVFDEVILICRNEDLAEELADALTESGIAYISLAILGVDPEANSRKAIVVFDEAELIHKAVKTTIPISRSLQYKGVAYTVLSQLDINPVNNLQQAITIFDEVLIICRANNLAKELSITLANYGVAYVSLSKLGVEQEAGFQKALDAFDEVIVFYRLEGRIKDLPIALNNSGIIYRNLAQLGINPETNLNHALHLFEEVAMICRTHGLVKDLAYNFTNLGNIYNNLAQLGISPEANYDRAIESYREALTFFNSDNSPAECFNTGSTLGNLGFKLGRWELALEGYSLAIEAIEQSRAWSREESHREEVQSNAIEVYTNIVQALIQLHRYPEALQYAERSRSKRLSDLMRVNDFYQKGEIPTEIKAKLEAYDALQRQIDAIYHKLDGNSQTLTLDTLRPSISAIEKQHVTALEAQQTTLWQELRRLDPIAAAGKRIIPLEIAEIGQLLGNDNHTALLSFFSTPTDTFIFIARRDSQQQLQIAVHHCPDQGIRTFHDAILEQWIKPYYADNNYSEWSKQITPFLQECSDRLSIDTLIAQHLDDTITDLILIPHLYLHQIPFAALPLTPIPQNEASKNPLLGGVPEGRGGCLGDRFTIRYAPSCEILKICDDRPDLNASLNYGIIEGASLDVPYGIFQGKEIATLLNIPPAQRLCGTTEATIDNFKQLAQTVNILHSYHHATSNPNEPLKSSLALADGNITLAQLLVWQLTGLQEVFLSCCETAFGISQTSTDEIFTLASGFLCAGARTVIATLWSVDQLSAALMCIFYYEQREQGLDRPRALQAAQQQLRQLSGTTLDNVYGERLEACLEINREQLSRAHDVELTKGEKAAEASFERLQKVEDMTKNLKYLCGQKHPFSDPVYWAAFTCQGLP